MPHRVVYVRLTTDDGLKWRYWHGICYWPFLVMWARSTGHAYQNIAMFRLKSAPFVVETPCVSPGFIRLPFLLAKPGVA